MNSNTLKSYCNYLPHVYCTPNCTIVKCPNNPHRKNYTDIELYINGLKERPIDAYADLNVTL